MNRHSEPNLQRSHLRRLQGRCLLSQQEDGTSSYRIVAIGIH